MAQPQQVKFVDPNNSWCQIDNGASQVVITATGTPQTSNNQTGIDGTKTTLGFDNTLNGSNSQGSNPTSDTGSVLIDISGNDTIAYPDPSNATVNGNPISVSQFAYKTVTTVLNNYTTSTTLAFKNPA